MNTGRIDRCSVAAKSIRSCRNGSGSELAEISRAISRSKVGVEIFDPVVEHGPQCGHPRPPTLRTDLEAIPNRRVGRQAFPHRSIELQHQSAERNHRCHVDKCPLHRCHTERAQLADVSRLEPPRPMDSRPSYGGPVVPRNTQVDD